MKRYNTIAQENQKYRYQPRKLPHLFGNYNPIFFTYRLKFTLPQPLIKALNERKAEWHKDLLSLKEAEKAQVIMSKDGLFFTWYDELLAKSQDVPQVLHRADITQIIATAFTHFDKGRYELLAYCVMPNHVHVLILPLKQESGEIFSPSHIIYSWKRWTANRINQILERKGSLWQQECYDHLVRNEDELMHTVDYIIHNPVKAGLAESWEQWQGTWLRDDLR
jgi:putative transposase